MVVVPKDEKRLQDPIKNRSCTDILCLLLFLGFIVGWFVVAGIAFSQGQPELIVYPSNSSGVVCGRHDNANKPYVMFHDLTKCFRLSAALGCATPQVCLEKCPNGTTSLAGCLKVMPDQCADLVEEYRPYCVPMSNTEWDSLKDNPQKLIDDKLCPAFILASVPIIGRCVPDFGIISNLPSKDTIINVTNGDYPVLADINGTPINGDIINQIIKYLTDILNARQLAEKVWADLVSSWPWILGGQIVSLFVSFFWIILVRFIPGPMIYLSMVLSLALLGLGAAYSWIKYDDLEQQGSPSDVFVVNPLQDDLSDYLAISGTWLVFFITCVVLFAILFLIMIFLRKRINIAIELIKEASKAVASIMSSLFFPIIPFIMEVAVISLFCVVAAYLASTGRQKYVVAHECTGGPRNGEECDPDNFASDSSCEQDKNSTCIFYKFTPSDTNNYLQLYNIFGLFWGMFFASAFGEMVLAGGFSSWYWADDKSKDVPFFTLTASLLRTVRYHLGTLAFGSLVIAIVRMIRLAIQYIEEKVKEKNLDNIFVKAIMCCCKCCFYCLEKFLKFINRNAYIITASYGYNFCRSAREAFSLITRNMVRAVVLDKVTDFLMFLGKLVVVGSVTVLAFYVFSGKLDGEVPLDVESPKLNYYFVPIIIIAISAYMISSCFFSVFSMAVDTLFLCFLLDLEKNDGVDNPHYHMSKNLMKILDVKNKKEK